MKQGSKVNLEKALRLSDRLGGHLVSGHVDGKGIIGKFEKLEKSFFFESKLKRYRNVFNRKRFYRSKWD